MVHLIAIFFISSDVLLAVNEINIGTAPIGFKTEIKEDIIASNDIVNFLQMYGVYKNAVLLNSSTNV